MSLWLYKGKILVNSDGTVVDDDECCCNKSSSAVKCWFKYASYLQAGCDDSGSWSCKWTAPTLQAQGCSATNPFGYAPGVWHFQCGGTSDASVRGMGYYVTSIVPEGNPTDCNGVTCTAPGFNGPIPEGDCPASGNPYFSLEEYIGYEATAYVPQQGSFDWQLMLGGSPVANPDMLDPHEEGYYYEYRMVESSANQTDHDVLLFDSVPRFKDISYAEDNTRLTGYQIDDAHWCNRNFSWKLTWSDDDKLKYMAYESPTWEFKDAALSGTGFVDHYVYAKTENKYDADSTVLRETVSVGEGSAYLKRNMCPTWSDKFVAYTKGADLVLNDYYRANYYDIFLAAVAANGVQWCIYTTHVTDATNYGDDSETKYTGYVVDVGATVQRWKELKAMPRLKYCALLDKWLPAQIETIGSPDNVLVPHPLFKPTLKGINFSWVAGTCNMRGWAIRESHLMKFDQQYAIGDCTPYGVFKGYDKPLQNGVYGNEITVCENTLVPTPFKTVLEFFAPSPSGDTTSGSSLYAFSSLHLVGNSKIKGININGSQAFRSWLVQDVGNYNAFDTYALQLLYLRASKNFPNWYYNTERLEQILPTSMENPLQMYYEAREVTREDTGETSTYCDCVDNYNGRNTEYSCVPSTSIAPVSRTFCAVTFIVYFEWEPKQIEASIYNTWVSGWDEYKLRGYTYLTKTGNVVLRYKNWTQAYGVSTQYESDPYGSFYETAFTQNGVFAYCIPKQLYKDSKGYTSSNVYIIRDKRKFAQKLSATTSNYSAYQAVSLDTVYNALSAFLQLLVWADKKEYTLALTECKDDYDRRIKQGSGCDSSSSNYAKCVSDWKQGVESDYKNCKWPYTKHDGTTYYEANYDAVDNYTYYDAIDSYDYLVGYQQGRVSRLSMTDPVGELKVRIVLFDTNAATEYCFDEEAEPKIGGQAIADFVPEIIGVPSYSMKVNVYNDSDQAAGVTRSTFKSALESVCLELSTVPVVTQVASGYVLFSKNSNDTIRASTNNSLSSEGKATTEDRQTERTILYEDFVITEETHPLDDDLRDKIIALAESRAASAMVSTDNIKEHTYFKAGTAPDKETELEDYMSAVDQLYTLMNGCRAKKEE